MAKSKTADKPDITMLSIDKLIPYARNTKQHSEAQVSQIAASIREFGFMSPVLIDDEGTILAGHGRVRAAQKLELAEVPCVRFSHLTDAQKRAYRIVDNKLPELSPWDDELLAVEFQELTALEFDLSLTGFDSFEIEGLSRVPEFEPGTEDEQGKLDELAPQMVTCPGCGKEFNAREQG